MGEFSRETRLHGVIDSEAGGSVEDQRNPFQRDRDRVLYSKAFRRLTGVSQVARVGESFFYHDRLSHSIKVAQVARTLAEILLDRRDYDHIDIEEHLSPNVVETAALAHDLGHPPFGHAAEEALKEAVPAEYGSFEGNAQSFRIICHSEVHRLGEPGLDLTLASCNAVLKYPWSIDEKEEKSEDNKWGYYKTEEDSFEAIREIVSITDKPNLEAQIMDYADDLTYAIHDMEDFYRAGVLPLDQLLEGTDERDKVVDHIADCENLPKREIISVFETLDRELVSGEDSTLYTPFKGTDKEISELNRFTSQLVERYLAPFNEEEVRVEEDNLRLEVEDKFKKEITVLAELTHFYVIDDSPLMTQQWGQKEIVVKIYEALCESVDPSTETENILSQPHRERIEKLDDHQQLERVRIVVDLITSMTERQAVEFFKRLQGISPGSLREGILK